MGGIHRWPVNSHTKGQLYEKYFHLMTSLWFVTQDFIRYRQIKRTWWRHQMETFSTLLALCAGNSPDSGEFPAQRPVTRSFDVFFDLRLIKRLSKHSRGWWFETLSRPSWRHCDDNPVWLLLTNSAIMNNSRLMFIRNSIWFWYLDIWKLCM